MLKSENVQVKESFLSIGSIKCFSPLATSRRSLACCCFMVSKIKDTVGAHHKNLHLTARWHQIQTINYIDKHSSGRITLLLAFKSPHSSNHGCSPACLTVCLHVDLYACPFIPRTDTAVSLSSRTQKITPKKHKNLHSSSKVRTGGG